MDQHDDDVDERTRFWPDGTKVVYDDPADASEHRLRMQEAGITHLDFMGLDEPDYNEFGDYDMDEDFDDDDCDETY